MGCNCGGASTQAAEEFVVTFSSGADPKVVTTRLDAETIAARERHAGRAVTVTSRPKS